MFKSLAISDAIYESPWYEQSEAAKKLLLIMLMRAQKPFTLTIGPFNPMTTETVLMVRKYFWMLSKNSKWIT